MSPEKHPAAKPPRPEQSFHDSDSELQIAAPLIKSPNDGAPPTEKEPEI